MYSIDIFVFYILYDDHASKTGIDKNYQDRDRIKILKF